MPWRGGGRFGDDHRPRPLQGDQRLHGHDGGDDVLREFARRLRKNVRGIDLACRFGGEEFVVAMPDTDGAVAEKVAERIRAEIAQMPFAIGHEGKTIEVTVSVGVSSVRKGDRYGRGADETRRPCALRGQERWPQPRRRQGCLKVRRSSAILSTSQLPPLAPT